MINLDHFTPLQRLQLGITQHLNLILGVLVHIVLEVIFLVKDGFGDDVVIVDKDSWSLGRLILVITEPGHLQSLLEVSISSVVLSLDTLHLAILLVDLLDHEVAPVDEGRVLILLQLFRINSINDDPETIQLLLKFNANNL